MIIGVRSFVVGTAAVMFGLQSANAADCVAEKMVLDFENGLAQFAEDIKSAKGATIELVTEGCRTGSCARIQSHKRQGVVRLGTMYRPKCDGDITVAGYMKIDELKAGGTHRDGKLAKFILRVSEPGENDSYHGRSDIDQVTNGWVHRETTILDLGPTTEILFRIGFEESKGIGYWDDIELVFKPH